jgi:hypothetical protein
MNQVQYGERTTPTGAPGNGDEPVADRETWQPRRYMRHRADRGVRDWADAVWDNILTVGGDDTRRKINKTKSKPRSKDPARS